MAKNDKISFTQLRIIPECFLIMFSMIITGCSKEEDPVPEDNMAAIRKNIMGNYLVDGVYNGNSFDDKLVAITSSGTNDIEISGTEFPAFTVTNLFVGYKGSTPDEYTVFSKAAAPNDGSITFAFPKKEVTVVTEIQIDNTTKNTLTFTGTKQE